MHVAASPGRASLDENCVTGMTENRTGGGGGVGPLSAAICAC